MALKALFFDVGETLLDERRMWTELGRLAGVEPHVIWAGMGSIIEQRRHHSDVFDLLGVEHPGMSAAGFEYSDWYPDALPCLERVRAAGYFVGVAGNIGADPRGFFADQGADVDFVTSSFTLGVEKPSTAFFHRLVDVAGCLPAEAAYVGDRVDNDVLPSAEAGLRAIHIRRGPWGYLQKGAERAHLRIRSLDELPDALASLG